MLYLQRLSSFSGRQNIFVTQTDMKDYKVGVCTWHICCLDLRYLSSNVLHKPLIQSPCPAPKPQLNDPCGSDGLKPMPGTKWPLFWNNHSSMQEGAGMAIEDI